MRASWKLDRCRRAVERLSEAEPRWEEFSGELIALLRPAVGFDGWCAALAAYSPPSPISLPHAAGFRNRTIEPCFRRSRSANPRQPGAAELTTIVKRCMRVRSPRIVTQEVTNSRPHNVRLEVRDITNIAYVCQDEGRWGLMGVIKDEMAS